MEKKLNLTQQKHTFTNQKMYYNTNANKLKPGVVAFYQIRLGNGAVSKETISKGGDK